ncbi:MAG TPA: ribose 5-phosphate isomerase B [Gemmatimonadaceae bacterium]|jgi:ribose 5-phosphate isomerase B|nr:ribose 5-phosphate isomerase B [Gemmatimonadaceae bacterium]
MARARVITERDVRRAANGGSRELDATGAIITPSARDAAVRSGVTLKGSKRGPPQREARRAGSRSELVPSPSETSVQTPALTPSPAPAQRIAVGADHGGVALRDAIAARLRELGHDVTDHGTTGTSPVDYPDYAIAVARAVATGGARIGIMVDGAGIGSCMTANKVPGVRAAMCHDVTTAQNAREHNNANVLTLGGGLIGTRLALAIVETFLSTSFGGGRHAARVAKIDALDAPRVQR